MPSRIKIEISGRDYFVEDIQAATGLSLGQVRARMRQFLRGEIGRERLFRPAKITNRRKWKDVAVETTTAEQKAMLAEFRRLTINDDRVFEKYYPSR